MRASGLCGVRVPGAQRLGGGWRGRLLVLQGAGRKDTPTRSRNRCPHAPCRNPRLALPVSSGLGCLAVCPVPRILFSPIGTVFALRRPRRQRAAARLPSRSRAAPLQQALSAEQLPFPRLVAQAFADAPSARDDRHSQEILANGRPAGSGPWSSPCSAGKREPSGLLEQGAASPVSSNWFPGSLRTLKLFPVPRLPRCEALTAGLPVEFSGWTALRAPYLGAGSWPRSPPGERWWSSSDLGPPWAAARLGRPAAWGAPRSASVSPRPRGQCGSFESRESML